jgi:hypothetical protein
MVVVPLTMFILSGQFMLLFLKKTLIDNALTD